MQEPNNETPRVTWTQLFDRSLSLATNTFTNAMWRYPLPTSLLTLGTLIFGSRAVINSSYRRYILFGVFSTTAFGVFRTYKRFKPYIDQLQQLWTVFNAMSAGGDGPTAIINKQVLSANASNPRYNSRTFDEILRNVTISANSTFTAVGERLNTVFMLQPLRAALSSARASGRPMPLLNWLKHTTLSQFIVAVVTVAALRVFLRLAYATISRHLVADLALQAPAGHNRVNTAHGSASVALGEGDAVAAAAAVTTRVLSDATRDILNVCYNLQMSLLVPVIVALATDAVGASPALAAALGMGPVCTHTHTHTQTQVPPAMPTMNANVGASVTPGTANATTAAAVTLTAEAAEAATAATEGAGRLLGGEALCRHKLENKHGAASLEALLSSHEPAWAAYPLTPTTFRALLAAPVGRVLALLRAPVWPRAGSALCYTPHAQADALLAAARNTAAGVLSAPRVDYVCALLSRDLRLGQTPLPWHVWRSDDPSVTDPPRQPHSQANVEARADEDAPPGPTADLRAQVVYAAPFGLRCSVCSPADVAALARGEDPERAPVNPSAQPQGDMDGAADAAHTCTAAVARDPSDPAHLAAFRALFGHGDGVLARASHEKPCSLLAHLLLPLPLMLSLLHLHADTLPDELALRPAHAHGLPAPAPEEASSTAALLPARTLYLWRVHAVLGELHALLALPHTSAAITKGVEAALTAVAAPVPLAGVPPVPATGAPLFSAINRLAALMSTLLPPARDQCPLAPQGSLLAVMDAAESASTLLCRAVYMPAGARESGLGMSVGATTRSNPTGAAGPTGGLLGPLGEGEAADELASLLGGGDEDMGALLRQFERMMATNTDDGAGAGLAGVGSDATAPEQQLLALLGGLSGGPAAGMAVQALEGEAPRLRSGRVKADGKGKAKGKSRVKGPSQRAIATADADPVGALGQ